MYCSRSYPVCFGAAPEAQDVRLPRRRILQAAQLSEKASSKLADDQLASLIASEILVG